MQFVVDRGSCVGTGVCLAEQPEVFEIGPDNRAMVKPLAPELPPALAVRVADMCPMSAIAVVGPAGEGS